MRAIESVELFDAWPALRFAEGLDAAAVASMD
jgi:hypothetical protein